MSARHALPAIPLVTAAGARALDAETIATLPSSFALMQRAGELAAAWVHAHCDERRVAVYVGPGNNGGDGWVIAARLRQLGWQVAVAEAAAPRTPDAAHAKALAEQAGVFTAPDGTEPLVLDALLGTGATGAPRGDIATALAQVRRAYATGATVIAIDIPSALDATTGDDTGAVPAAHTLTFGSVKQGQLLRRDLVGALHVLDIGLRPAAADTPRLLTALDVANRVPGMAPDAWKGTRGRVAIVGGAPGMAGAVILAARAAHATGAGMVRADVSHASSLALQIAAPFATVYAWHTLGTHEMDVAWPDALVIGPGLDGSVRDVHEQVLSLLQAWRGPVVLDAGALSAFAPSAADALHEDISAAAHWPGADDTAATARDALAHALRGREALLTPHAGEFKALGGTLPDAAARFTAAAALAASLGATVLLKGVPTVIASPDGTTLVSATGTPALAVGGSGDVLAGIAGALLAQGLTAPDAAAVAAWVHGTAAEQATAAHGGWRGVTLEAVVEQVTRVWSMLAQSAHASQDATAAAQCTLPAVSSR